MDPRKPSKDEQDFVRVVKIAVALGLGSMAAFLYSLKQVHPSIRLEFGFGALVAFVITASVSWMFCGVLFRSEFSEGDSAHAARLRKRRVARWILFFAVISSLATAGAFLYSLKDVASEGRSEVIQGTLMAVVVLSIGGFLIHKTVRFFEEQDKISLEERENDPDRDA